MNKPGCGGASCLDAERHIRDCLDVVELEPMKPQIELPLRHPLLNWCRPHSNRSARHMTLSSGRSAIACDHQLMHGAGQLAIEATSSTALTLSEGLKSTQRGPTNPSDKLQRRKRYATVATRLVYLFQLIRNLLRFPRASYSAAGSALNVFPKRSPKFCNSWSQNFQLRPFC
jgi:hypothetical protein